MQDTEKKAQKDRPELADFRVAILVADGTEETELLEPLRALHSAGARVEILAPGGKAIRCFRQMEPAGSIQATRRLEDAQPDHYSGLLLPGGALAADRLRAIPEALAFAHSFQEQEKPIAAICHAPWILISAGLVRGRTLTSHPGIGDDIRNAGGKWVDNETECDSNWVTSRNTADLPAFCREMIGLFARSTPPVIQVDLSA